MEHKETLHRALKELKQLEDYKMDDSAEYEAKVKSVIHHLRNFLSLDGDNHVLSLWTNIETIGDFSVAYHGTPSLSAVNVPNVMNHLRSGSVDNNSLRGILQLLSDPANPLRIKSDYQPIARRLTEILHHTIQMRDSAEQALKDYVCSCLLYDMNFYKDLVNEDEDTQILADIIESQDNDDDGDSIFGTTRSVEIYHPLELGSNSSSFLAIYRLLLPVLVSRPALSIWKVSCSIVEVFKKHQRVRYFQSGEEADISTLLPNMHRQLNEKYILESIRKPNEESVPIDPKSVLPGLVQIVTQLKDFSKDVNPDFPSLFKHYVEFMDQNLSIATKEDYEYVEEMPLVVESILESESLTDLMGVLDRFIFLQSLLLCESPSISVTLLMRASCFDFERQRGFEESVFQIWKGKLERVERLERLYAKLDKRPHILSKWRLARKKIELRDQATTSHYEERLQLFVIWRLKVALKRTKELDLKAGLLELKRVFKKWLSAFLLVRGRCTDAEKLYTKNQLLKYMNTWKERSNHIEQAKIEFEERCDDFVDTSRVLLLQRYFCKWRKIVNAEYETQLFSKLQQFKEIRNHFVVEIFFGKWRQSTELVFKLENFKRDQNYRTIRMILSNWRCKLQLDEWAQKTIHDHNIANKEAVFQKWMLNASRALEARSFQDKNLVQRYFKRWKTRRNANVFVVKAEVRTVRNVFRNWQLQALATRSEDSANRELVVYTYKLWKDKFGIALGHDTEALAFKNHLLARFAIEQWKYSFYSLQDKETQAERMIKKRLLTRWQTHFNTRKQELENVKVIDKYTQRYFFSIWRDKYDDAVEDKLATRIPQFTDYTDALMKSKYLSEWREQYFYQKELQNIEFSFNPALHTFILHWIKRLDEVRELDERIAIYNDGVMYRTLSQWRWRFEQIDAINEQGEDYLAQKNFALLRQSTQDWIFKFNKGVKRHYQLLGTFQERSDKRLASNVIHLWLQKHRDKLEEEELANETYVSNSSPLASRAHQQRQQQREPFAPTPQRRFSPNKMSTPRSKLPSPSKLQETSQRMRDQQVSQLRERFGRAKLSPRYKVRPISPVKLNYNVDLSPPKDEKSSDFENEFRSPNTSSSSSPTDTQSYSLNDSSVISTAKRMGRIKPISFPTGEENDVKLSPASKVKRESRILI